MPLLATFGTGCWERAWWGQGLGALPVQTGVSNLEADTPKNSLLANQLKGLSLSCHTQLSLYVPHPRSSFLVAMVPTLQSSLCPQQPH